MGISDSERNERMQRVAPELKSKWAKYPLKGSSWLSPDASIDHGDGTKSTAFIPHPKDPGYALPPRKEDYVWGTGPKGFGYYHLLTRDSYVILNNRVRLNRPPPACCYLGDAQANEDFDVVSEILWNRSLASAPDDVLAVSDALKHARGEAQSHYHMDQNIQLAVMTTF